MAGKTLRKSYRFFLLEAKKVRLLKEKKQDLFYFIYDLFAYFKYKCYLYITKQTNY